MHSSRIDTGFFASWWKTIDRYSLFAIFALVAFGFVLVMAASPAVAERIGLPSFHFVHRQVIFTTMGVCIMLGLCFMPVSVLRPLSVLGFGVCILLLIAVLVIGDEIKGATRWLYLAGFTLQPSEITKPFLAMVTALVLSKRLHNPNFPAFGVAFLCLVAPSALFIMQPDFGMTVAISTVWAVQMFLAGLPLIWVGALGGIAVCGAVCAYIFLPHVAHRINSFLTQDDMTYQARTSMQAFENGGALGMGPGEGRVKNIIPDAHTDFIFAVAGEEMGFVACVALIGLFAFIIMRGFMQIYRERDFFIILAVSGLLTQFGLQALINMGVTLRLLPNTGMTLPFVSYGGSSTIATAITLGMVLSLTRTRYGNVMGNMIYKHKRNM